MKSLDIIKDLDTEMCLKLFKEDLQPVKPEGFIILFDGERVKPIEGKVDIYASKAAALEALKRNSRLGSKLREHIFLKLLGFNWITDHEKYKQYFYNPDIIDPKTGYKNSGGYKNEEVRAEYGEMYYAANTAISYLLRQYQKQGRLVIQQL